VQFITGDIGNYFSITLTRWFTGCVNVHYQMPYAAVVGKIDHGVTYPHDWKAIHFIAGQRIALAADILY
jgi:hypothetical protein